MTKEKAENNASWNMTHEKEFIKNLGTGKYYDWSEMNLMLPSRQELLLKYIVACQNRNAWDGMDQGKIIAYARSQLFIG